MTASFRVTANLAFLKPMRCLRRTPQRRDDPRRQLCIDEAHGHGFEGSFQPFAERGVITLAVRVLVPMLAIPFFILAGGLMMCGRFGEYLVTFATMLVGFAPGITRIFL